MGFLATMYGSPKSHYPWLKCHENEEKFDNDYVLRNDHRIKITQPIPMILVSFFWEDNVLSDEIKICCIFEYQSNKIVPLFWDTRYYSWMYSMIKHWYTDGHRRKSQLPCDLAPITDQTTPMVQTPHLRCHLCPLWATEVQSAPNYVQFRAPED